MDIILKRTPSIIGALALAGAALLFLLTGTISTWIFVLVLIGIIGIGMWIGLAPDEFQAWLSGRQTRYGTTSLLITILFVGFVIFVYALIDRANITVDLTSVQRYTLNRPTLDTIDQLEDRGIRVRIVGFFSRYTMREQESADLLLRQYVAAGENTVEVEYVDPDEQPDVADQYGYQSGYDGDLFLSVLGTDGEPDFSITPLYLGSVSERDITTGLKTIASAGMFRIYFTTGHEELDLERLDEVGISRLGVSLIGQGIDVIPLPLADVEAIPEDASAVLIVGARSPFTEVEVERIDAYLQRGGHLAIFTDPPLVDEGESLTNTFLQEGDPLSTYLWDEFGIRPLDALIIETQSTFTSEFNPIVNTIMPHEMLSDVRDTQIVMQFARPILITDSPDERQSQYVRESLLLSSDASYGEADLNQLIETSQIGFNQGDIAGPLVMGATVRRLDENESEVKPRIVIIGDSDVVQNEFVTLIPGNVFLWSDIIDWLTGFSDTVTFTPVNDPTLLPLQASESERNWIAYITLLILPGVMLISGAGVWWYRRR